MVLEYNPSYKLLVFNLPARLLRADKRSMNIPEDVNNRIIILIDHDKFVYRSERLTAKAPTETYKYMIKKGLEYSYLVTAGAFVLLWVRENEPHTLYYHLAEPNSKLRYKEKSTSYFVVLQ